MKKDGKLAQFIMNCKKFWEWIKEKPRNAVIAVSIFLTVVIGLVLFFKFVFPTLFLIALLVFTFFGDKISALLSKQDTPPMQTLEDNSVCWAVTTFMFSAMGSVNNVISAFINAPHNTNDIFDGTDYRTIYNNAPILKLRLMRKNRETMVDCSYIKSVLQGAVDSRIRDGYLMGYSWAVSAAADIPLIKIALLDFSDMYIYVSILLTNTSESVQAARLSDNPAPPPSVDDIDPLF